MEQSYLQTMEQFYTHLPFALNLKYSVNHLIPKYLR